MGNSCVSEDPSVGCAAVTRQNWDNVMRKLAYREGEAEMPTIADGTNDSTIAKTLRSKTFFVAKALICCRRPSLIDSSFSLLAQGMTFQDLFEFKRMDDYFVDVDDWKK